MIEQQLVAIGVDPGHANDMTGVVVIVGDPSGYTQMLALDGGSYTVEELTARLGELWQLLHERLTLLGEVAVQARVDLSPSYHAPEPTVEELARAPRRRRKPYRQLDGLVPTPPRIRPPSHPSSHQPRRGPWTLTRRPT